MLILHRVKFKIITPASSLRCSQAIVRARARGLSAANGMPSATSKLTLSVVDFSGSDSPNGR